MENMMMSDADIVALVEQSYVESTIINMFF